MLSTPTIAEEILELKTERKAIILAHHYQDSEIQELADAVGDSLELARKAKQFERQNMKIWQGACIVHATFPARRLLAARTEHPQALVAAHPECPQDVLNMADFIGSTSAIIDWCTSHGNDEFIVMTESGVSHSLHKLAPNKRFYFV